MGNIPSLIESICIKDGKIQLVEFHNQRANSARSTLYNSAEALDFSKVINIDKATHDITKCRIVYGDKIEKIEYLSYRIRPIDSLKTIEVKDDWSYKHKYLDRTKLDYYFDQKEDADDIIMIQCGLVTDSYYCNLAFLKNGIWYTPAKPLLNGTRRASLINKEQIIEKDIPLKEIQTYESLRLFNALIEFGQIEISTNSIF